MATAEQLLHEARYAVSNISFGQSRRNRRSRSRAKSLCRKIIRRFPGSIQAGQAAEILQQLGVADVSPGVSAPRHASRRETPKGQQLLQASKPSKRARKDDGNAVNWREALGLITKLPGPGLVILAMIGVLLFFIFGPFLLVVIAVMVIISLNRSSSKGMKPKQAQQINAMIARAGEYLDRKTGH